MAKSLSKNVLFAGFVLLVLFSACKKDEDAISEDRQRTILDVSYGQDPKQKMDVYLPPNRSTDHTPVLIIIHGGGFVAGDRKQFAETFPISNVINKGWAVINVSYRLVDATGMDEIPPAHRESAVKVTDQVDDIATLVDYVLIHAREWAINGHKMGVAGHSAGGSLALLYAYDSRNFNDNTRKVKAVANWAGALDLTYNEGDLDGLDPLLQAIVLEGGYRFTGHTVSEANKSHFEAISATHVVTASRKTPTLNIFPENNVVGGLPKQDRETYDQFVNKLDQLGVPHKFVQFDGTDHGFGNPGSWLRVADETLVYFETMMQ